jgi:SpoVK/Ycf46/Vps4 family AAA+-type ATPase
MRPGRLDRLLYVGPPDQSGREEILRIRMSRMSIDPAVDVEEIARAVGQVSRRFWPFVYLLASNPPERRLFRCRTRGYMSGSRSTYDAEGHERVSRPSLYSHLLNSV